MDLFTYAKSVAAAVGGVVTAVTVATADEAITFDEARGIWLAVVLAATVVGVWRVPNKDG